MIAKVLLKTPEGSIKIIKKKKKEKRNPCVDVSFTIRPITSL